jgi:hypothetical protein
MQLADRYLVEIGRYLPPQQRDDILAEIGDSLQSQVDERQHELGRTLTVDEAAAIIKAYGNPKIVAARYKPQQYLIGPELFPFYFSTIKLLLVVVFGFELVGAAIAALLDHWSLSAFFGGFAPLFPTVVWAFGIVTLIFAVLERTKTESGALSSLFADRWDPRSLPETVDRIPRFQTLFDIFVNLIALFWLLDVPTVRHLFGTLTLGPAASHFSAISLTPVWHSLFVVLEAGTAAIVAVDFVLLARPDWTRLRAATLFGVNVLFVAAIGVLLSSRHFIDVTGNGPRHAELVAGFDTLAQYVIIGVAVVCAVVAVVNLLTLLRRPRRSFAPPVVVRPSG